MLEVFELISLDRLVGAERGLVLVSKEVGVGENVFKVLQLLLQELVLSREAAILLADILLELLHFLNFFFQVILVESLSHPGANGAFSVLHSLPGLFVLVGVVQVGEATVLVEDLLLQIFFLLLSDLDPLIRREVVPVLFEEALLVVFVLGASLSFLLLVFLSLFLLNLLLLSLLHLAGLFGLALSFFGAGRLKIQVLSVFHIRVGVQAVLIVLQRG